MKHPVFVMIELKILLLLIIMLFIRLIRVRIEYSKVERSKKSIRIGVKIRLPKKVRAEIGKPHHNKIGNEIVSDAGVTLTKLINFSIKNGLSGLEERNLRCF